MRPTTARARRTTASTNTRLPASSAAARPVSVTWPRPARGRAGHVRRTALPRRQPSVRVRPTAARVMRPTTARARRTTAWMNTRLRASRAEARRVSVTWPKPARGRAGHVRRTALPRRQPSVRVRPTAARATPPTTARVQPITASMNTGLPDTSAVQTRVSAMSLRPARVRRARAQPRGSSRTGRHAMTTTGARWPIPVRPELAQAAPFRAAVELLAPETSTRS
jgi:hypothetical protein